uniref:Uncharacterized protein n=1 Tax=Anguilla anguilla TaxID=7936 RepID=A0A0E9S1N5_ANGAN
MVIFPERHNKNQFEIRNRPRPSSLKVKPFLKDSQGYVASLKQNLSQK